MQANQFSNKKEAVRYSRRQQRETGRMHQICLSVIHKADGHSVPCYTVTLTLSEQLR